MKNIQRILIERPITLVVFYSALLVLGTISLLELKINLLPSIEYPSLTIITSYANASPEEIENLITIPVMEGVSSVNGLKDLTSESIEGISYIHMRFTWNTRVDFAAMDVREKLDLVRTNLPEDVGRSVIARFNPSESPVIELAFFPVEQSPASKDLRFFLEKNVKGFLDRVDGVAAVEFSGGYKKEILVDSKIDLLNTYNVTLDDISASVSATNVNQPAGHITMGNTDILLRSMGQFENLLDIGETIIGFGNNGEAIPLASVASISDTYSDRKGLARYNGKETVIASIFREAGRNTTEVADNIIETLDTIEDTYGEKLKYVIVYDESRFVRASINSLKTDLLLGGALSFISLLVVLRNYRSPLILLSAVPISIISTFLFMHLAGLSLNMMTLGGLTLGIGMLFDSGNVTLSAIERHIRNGSSPLKASIDGSGEVIGSVSTAVFTTIIIFFPIIFLKGPVGIVFSEMALTISFSNIVSLIVALTFLPMLSAHFPKATLVDRKGWISKFHLVSNRIFFLSETMERKLLSRYTTILIKILDYPGKAALYSIIAIMIAIGFYFFIEKRSAPRVDTGTFEIKIKNYRGASLESTTEVVSNLEKVILSLQDVKHVVSRVGYDEEQIINRSKGDTGIHRAELRVVMNENHSMKIGEAVSYIRAKISIGDDVSIVYNVKEDILSELINPGGSGITLEIHGQDLTTLENIGKYVKKDLLMNSGLKDISVSMDEKNREYRMKLDVDRLGVYGIYIADVADLLRTAVKGKIITHFRENDKEIPIRLRVTEKDRSGINELGFLKIKTATDSFVPLSQIASITTGYDDASIIRASGNRINRITANIDGRADTVINQVEKYISTVKLPEGYSLRFSGEKIAMDESFEELAGAFILAVFLVYLLLAGKYESFRFSAIMLATIPLVLVGAFPALLISNKGINISSFTGFILLVGIIVDAGALFFEYLEIFLQEGFSLRNSIIKAGEVSFQPVLLNTGTTIFGLFPVALGFGEGTEFQAPMAVTVISGLSIGVLLTLFIIPVFFYWLLSEKNIDKSY